MATLTVTCVDAEGNFLADVEVVAYLSDAAGNPLQEVCDEGFMVSRSVSISDALGVAVFDLIPNSHIHRDNTVYTIQVHNARPVVILKGDGAETLEAAMVATSPPPLGEPLGIDALYDVSLAGIAVNDILKWDGTKFVPGQLSAGTFTRYTHTQSTPATTWTINHNLGRHPVMTALDTSGREMLVEFTHNSLNQATAVLLTPLTGTVDCV